MGGYVAGSLLHEAGSLLERMRFDGFHAMCRNLFLTMVILQTFARYSNGKLAEALAAGKLSVYSRTLCCTGDAAGGSST